MTRRAGASAREAASRQPCGAGQACRARHANRNPPAPHLTRGGRGGSASTDDAPFRARLTARQTARAFGTPYRLMPQPLTHARATRYAGRPSTLRRARSRQHSAVRSPPPCLRFGKAEDFTRGAGNLSHRFAAQSGPAPRMKSAAYPYPQWRRTPRYARLSRRRDAPRWRVGAGGRFAATLRGWASVPRTARQPEPPCPAPHEGGQGGERVNR